MKHVAQLLLAWLLVGRVLAAVAGDVETYAKRISSLVDPAKLATLGVREANPRVEKYVAILAASSIRITITGAPSQTYIVQAATNLAAGNWQPIATNSSGTNRFEIYETQAGVVPLRYYRALVP